DIPGLAPKTYEQSIGFLRVLDGDHPLDRTPIHTECYKDTEKLLDMIRRTLNDNGTGELKDELNEVDLKEATKILGIGEALLIDIIKPLRRSGQDPRYDFP